MRPSDVVVALPATELTEAARQALQCRGAGVPPGEALRRVALRMADEAGVDEYDALRVANTALINEAARRFVEAARS